MNEENKKETGIDRTVPHEIVAGCFLFFDFGVGEADPGKRAIRHKAQNVAERNEIILLCGL